MQLSGSTWTRASPTLQAPEMPLSPRPVAGVCVLRTGCGRLHLWTLFSPGWQKTGESLRGNPQPTKF